MQNSKNDRFRSALTDAVTKRQHQRLFYRTPSLPGDIYVMPDNLLLVYQGIYDIYFFSCLAFM